MLKKKEHLTKIKNQGVLDIIAIKEQGKSHLALYVIFALVSTSLMIYYLSNTIIHFTTSQQFPINSFRRFPLSLLLFPAEVFSFCFSMYFVYNLINGNHKVPRPAILPNKNRKKIAILLPVYNEPYEIVMRTLNACKKLRWGAGIKIYLLDDSTNQNHKNEMSSLSKRYGCTLVTRSDRIGFKAGNINHAVSKFVEEEFFAIFDSDQAPEPNFLEETMDFFSDPHVGFVQTPQNFINSDTIIERASKAGTNIFYHSQCLSKARDGAMPFCGTNVVVRADVFRELKGFSYYTSTEDIELGLRMNQAGYHGAYVPKILVHGYAPTYYGAYASQQYRWANGNLAILRESWSRILFGKFSLRHQIHTFFTLGWWLIGVTTLIYIIVPILSLFFGGTHHTWLPSSLLTLLFLNVALGLVMIFASLRGRVEEEKITFADAFLQYSLITNSMFIYSRAAFAAFFKRYAGFVRTNKQKSGASFKEIKWNLLLSAICFGFSIYALFKSATAGDMQQIRTYLPVSVWLLFYSTILGSSIFFIDKQALPDVSIAPQPKISAATSPSGVG